jgi:hypothetical protein
VNTRLRSLDDGIVYGQNPPDLGEQAKATFEARLKSPAMKDVVADIRPFDDPIPPGVHDLDLITLCRPPPRFGLASACLSPSSSL